MSGFGLCNVGPGFVPACLVREGASPGGLTDGMGRWMGGVLGWTDGRMDGWMDIYAKA